jgi:hypothetical protein
MVPKIPRIDLQLLQLRSPLPRKIPLKKRLKQSRRGLLKWIDWKGNSYDIEDFDIWKKNPMIRKMEATDADLKHARQRLNSYSPSRAVDAFLVKHYTAELESYRSLLPFLRLEHELSIVLFCIRTAPSNLFNRLGPFTYNVHHVCYDIAEEVRQLLAIRLIQSNVSFNPLYFQTLASMLTHLKHNIFAKFCSCGSTRSENQGRISLSRSNVNERRFDTRLNFRTTAI